MIALIERRRVELAEICRRYHVTALEIFGSATTGKWDAARSDLDFLVQFEPLEPGRLFDCFFDLKASLESLFGCPVDLVSPRAIRNPYFLESVNRTRQVLYAE